MTPILVTGATGTVGSTLIPLLRGRGVDVRAFVRDPDRAQRISAAGVQIVHGDFRNPASLRAALEGVEAVFLACGNVPEQVEYECAVIDETERCGARRIVKLSARGAAEDSPVAYWRWHAMIERHLRASSTPATVLQPGFLMTNLLGAAESVRRQGMLFAPAAGAQIAMIHPSDVAASAAVALTERGHDGRTFVLTGPEALTYQRVADDLSAQIGRQIGYVDIPPEAATAALIGSGLPAFAAEQVVRVFDALRQGAQSTTTGSVLTLTGRDPHPFAGFARDYAGAFVDEASARVSA